MNVNDGCSTSFTKEALNDIPAGAIDWLREHRVSLLMFSTWGLVPSIPVSTDSVSQATVPPDDMPLAPAEITPASAGGASSETTPRAAGNAFVERSDWRPLSVEQLPLPLLQHKALLQCLRARPEWAQHRVEIKYRKRSRGQDFYEVECLDGLDCCKRWRAFYIFSAHDMHPPGTLILQTCGEHSHETRRATSKLFTSQQLSIAEGFLASGGRDLRGLQLAFSTANIASNTLPNSTQLSNWLKRQKKSQKNTLSRHATLVEVTRLELTALPRSMPDTLSALFLLDEPVLTQDEVCIIFSCPGMVRHFERYQDTTLCCTVDAKMKVAEHGYGVATFGLLTRDKLRKTTLSRAARTDSTPARTQGFAFTSHTVPVVQAIFHQETHGNFQRLFRAVDKLWQNSASPPRPSLATLPFQLHKDFKKEIETARVDCFPHSRACDDFFHWSQKQHTTMAAKCCKRSYERGNGSRNIWIGQLLRCDFCACFPRCACFPLCGLRIFVDLPNMESMTWSLGYEPMKGRCLSLWRSSTQVLRHPQLMSAFGLASKALWLAVLQATNLRRPCTHHGSVNFKLWEVRATSATC